MLTTITEFLTAAMTGASVLADVYPASRWTHSRAGWEPPILHEGLLVFAFCPEVIASNTAHLDEAGLHDYLTAVGACAHMHVIHHAIEPLHARTAIVEEMLRVGAPGSLQLLKAVDGG